ncbi:4'-phosphopantetheinyl transferase superfamily protein [bacterium]|nr:MAG: 4'-phosphopantetheinyl transferase superfamily protein [bacterium]
MSANSFQDGNIHLWKADLDTLSPSRLYPHLDNLEQQRAQHYQLPLARSRFIASRGQLREILSLCTGLPPAQLLIAYTPHGKPFLPALPDWHFSVSHSCNLAVWAISYGREVGIDIELIRPELPLKTLIPRTLSPREQEALAQHEGDPTSLFLHFWTRKEAFLKATGEPNFAHLPQIDASNPNGQLSLYSPQSNAWNPADNWQSHSFDSFPNCVTSIATQGPKPIIQL